jgi:hypothetical protein
VAEVIDYAIVLERMKQEGFESLYFNSGAFGFSRDPKVEIVGWVGSEDPSIRDPMRRHIRQAPPPYPETLARAVRDNAPATTVWFMPKSHWAYELDFGNRDWLPDALHDAGIEATALQPLTNAAAIQFSDVSELQAFLVALFSHLHGSDFMLAWPEQHTLCTLHHHQQAWWQTSDPGLAERLRQAF